MSDKLIVSCIVAVAVVVFATLFILRAVRHRRRLRTVDSDISEEDVVIELEPEDNTLRNRYLLQFICRNPALVIKGKYVMLRPKYHEKLKKIVRVIGHRELSIARYLDNVLYEHFQQHKDSIKQLYDENEKGLFKDDE